MRQKSTNPPPNILREIQADKILPVYLLCGEENFLIEGDAQTDARPPAYT